MNAKKMGVWIALIVLCTLAPAACAGGGKPEIVLKGASIVPSGMNNGVASAFLFIINDGGADDTLTGCAIKEYPSANPMLHDMAEGRMIMVPEIKVPAKRTTALERGGKHLMFSGLPDKLEGDVTLVLKFQKSGPLEIRASLQ